MSFRKMVGLVSGLAFAGAAIGGLIGWMMGVFLPDFYRATVPFATYPTQIGIGFGIAQGLLMGFILGLVVLGVMAYLKGKCARPDDPEG